MERPEVKGLRDQLFPPGSRQALELLRAAWPLAVGPELARRTELLAIEGRTLRVRVPDAHWRRILHRMQGQILSRLRAVAGKATPSALGMSEGSVAVPPPEPPPPAPKLIPAPAAVVEAAAAIPDPELRAAFLSSAALYLGRNR